MRIIRFLRDQVVRSEKDYGFDLRYILEGLIFQKNGISDLTT